VCLIVVCISVAGERKIKYNFSQIYVVRVDINLFYIKFEARDYTRFLKLRCVLTDCRLDIILPDTIRQTQLSKLVHDKYPKLQCISWVQGTRNTPFFPTKRFCDQ